MQISVFDSYESMSLKLAQDIIDRLKPISRPVFCVASGESPTGLYRELIKRHQEKQLDVSDWFFLGLDEWIGLDKNDEGSCRNMLERDLFLPLQVKEDHICFFDGKTNDPVRECRRVEEFIAGKGQVDLAVLGLGMNGHVGMNEPGTSPDILSHIAVLDLVTKQVGQKYFTKPRQLNEGITLGIGTLMRTKHLSLVVNGQKKAKIAERVIRGEIGKEVPATWLRNHPDFTIYMDADAAGALYSDPQTGSIF